MHEKKINFAFKLPSGSRTTNSVIIHSTRLEQDMAKIQIKLQIPSLAGQKTKVLSDALITVLQAFRQ